MTRNATRSFAPFYERFLSQVLVGDDCWEWQGRTNPKSGYGHCPKKYGRGYVHRASYEEFVGPIPDGLAVDHLCRNRRCVRPDHLEPVTTAENNRRTMLSHCKHGHPYEEGNLYFYKGHRRCRQCVIGWSTAYYNKKRSQVKKIEKGSDDATTTS